VRGWKKRCISVDTGVGQVSREGLDEKLAKDPACRKGTIKYDPTSTSRIKHAIKPGSVGLDYHSSEIPAPEMDNCWMVAAHWGIEQLETGRVLVYIRRRTFGVCTCR